MAIFNNIILAAADDNIIYNEWIEWNHFGIPNKPEWLRIILRNIYALFGHCLICTALDGCYFVTRIMPELPQHKNCHCKKLYIGFEKVKHNAKAACDIEKFTKYAFIDSNKKKLFNSWGYSSVEDAFYLQREYCKQAISQYIKCNYKLKNLDNRGQRLAIPTCLGSKWFYSGWMLCPEGKLKNATPFGGWIK